MSWIGDLFNSVAGSALGKMLLFLAAWLVQVLTQMINFVGTWWLKIGAPSMGEGSATDRIQDSTVVFVGVAGVIGTVFALIKIARNQDRASAENLVMGMLRTVFTSAIAVSMVSMLLAVTDKVAPWLVQTISGSAPEDGLGTAMGLDGLVGAEMTLTFAGLILFIAPLALIGAIINAALVIFSYGMAGALCGVLPIFAASSVTERGRKSFDKAVGWLIAVVLFKPAAAVLYGFGLALINGITGTAETEEMNRIISLLTGLVIILSACLAMPALARVLVPAVSAGPAGMGASGLAMLGGAVAVGALTGGIGAGAGAAAGAAAGGGGGAASGAAAAGTSTASSGSAAAGTSTASSATTSGIAGAETGAAGTGGASPTMASRPDGPPPSGGGPSAGTVGGTPPSEGSSGGGTAKPASGSERSDGSGTGGKESLAPAAATATPAGATSGAVSGGPGTNPATPVPQGQHGSDHAPKGDAAAELSGPSGAAGEPAGSGGAPAAAQESNTSSPAAESPTAEGFKNSSPDGTGYKSMMTRQRLEYGLREIAKDAENSVESGGDV